MIEQPTPTTARMVTRIVQASVVGGVLITAIVLYCVFFRPRPAAGQDSPQFVGDTFRSRAELFEALNESHRRVAVKEFEHAQAIAADPDYKRHAALTAAAVKDVRVNGPHIVGTRVWAIDAKGTLLFTNAKPVLGGELPKP